MTRPKDAAVPKDDAKDEASSSAKARSATTMSGASTDSASKDAALKGTALKGTAAKGTGSKDTGLNSTGPKGTGSKDTASKDAGPEGGSASAPALASSGALGAPRSPGSSPGERVSRGALLFVAAVAGVAVGTIGSFGHRTTDTWLGVSWPVGLLLCFGGLIGLLLGISELLTAGAPDSWRPTRLSALACASAGWLLALLWITYLGPPRTFVRKGDVILANDAKSMLYLLGGMFAITVAMYRAWVATLSARLASHPGAVRDGHSKG